MGWLSKYEWLNSCSGLEIHIEGDGSFKARSVSVILRNDELSISSTNEAGGDLHQILQRLKLSAQTAITVTGKGVLIRKAPIADADQLLNLFPSLDADKFYIQRFLSGDSEFISLIRKETADMVLKVCEACGVQVLVVGLGPFQVCHITRQFNHYGDSFQFNGHKMEYSADGALLNYHHADDIHAGFQLKIGIEVMPEQYVIAYAAAFQLALFNRLEQILANVGRAAESLNDFNSKKKLQVRIAVSAVAFFTFLLINFLVLSVYETKNADLAQKIDSSREDLGNIRHTIDDIAEREKLLKGLGWNGGIPYAYLCDQLGQTVPQGILLATLTVNPLQLQVASSGGKQIYDTGKIFISGETPGIGPVNDWISTLRSKNWVKQVRLSRFAQKDGETLHQEFSIIVDYL